MRETAVVLLLAIVFASGCDRSTNSGEGEEVLAAAGVAPSLFGSGETVQDSSPMVVRRVWYTDIFDIWSGPSRDGRSLPVTDWRGERGGALAVHDLQTGETHRVTAEPDPYPDAYAEHSIISPDGERVAYSWWSQEQAYELRLIGVNGSEPRVLYHDQSDQVQPRAWSADGESILVLAIDDRDNRIGLISASDGSFQVLKTLGRRQPFGLSVSPDGRYVIYDGEAGNNAQRDIFVITVATGGERRLVEHPADDLVLGWAPDGENVLFASDRSGTLGAWLLPVAGGRPVGAPRLVKPDLWNATPLGFAGNGSFYYAVSMHMADVYVATIDLETGQLLDRPTRASESFFGGNFGPEWSPDGHRLAYLSARKRWRAFGAMTIVARSTETGEAKELQPALSAYMHPRWSPDGRSILFRARDEVGQGFFQVDVQTGEVEPLIRFPPGSGNMASRAEWLTEGKALVYWLPPESYYENRIPETDREHFSFRVRDLETGRDETLYEGDISARFAISPDRQRLAFAARRNGRASLMVMPAAGGTPEVVIADCGEHALSEIQWSPDARYLYYVSGGLWRVPVAGGSPEKLEWFEQERFRPFFRFQPGGQRIAFTRVEGQGGSEVWAMENFLPSDPNTESVGERRTP
jgi:Tol biopolymer transport system component